MQEFVYKGAGALGFTHLQCICCFFAQAVCLLKEGCHIYAALIKGAVGVCCTVIVVDVEM